MTHPLTIATAHSVRVCGVLIVAILNDQARTLTLERHGEPKAEHLGVVELAGKLLLERMQRVRPDLKV